MVRSRQSAGSTVAVATLLLLGLLAVPPEGRPALAATPAQTGFQEQVVFSGLDRPTNIEFAPDGRVFVAEQRGTIKVFDDLADPAATVFADMRPVVHDVWDRGLLGMALHPEFPAQPWVYVLYTYDAPPGESAPYWNDNCNSVPGGSNGGRCVVTGRLSRLQVSGNEMTGTEQVLIHDWCQQYPSHSVGELHFGADGALYASAGDGASFSTVDYGQLPTAGPINPCGDPPGGTMQPPTAEGGALRSQALRSESGEPLTLDGTLLRLDPETGEALPDNPLIDAADPHRQRVVGHGLRNPYRITIRPGTNELWAADVGWSTWEEINVLADPTGEPANFGWPCYEGPNQLNSYANAGLDLCTSLYDGPGQSAPYYAYRHADRVVPGESCPTGGSAITGLAFYPTSGGAYPASFQGSLFFADHSRQCIWVMKPAAPGGLPSPEHIETFVAPASAPVDLAVGPGGELYWADIGGGTIRRIRYTPGNTPPTAVIDASPTSGALPLAVQFDGTGSFDPDPADQDALSYEWDFTDDGTVDATTPTAQFSYEQAGTYLARLTVTDTLGASDSATVTIHAGSQAPAAVIDTPQPGLTWAVGTEIGFSGHATDPQTGDPLPASALSWQLRIEHCAALGNCHTHVVQSWDQVASGSFLAPDHEYPAYLELELTAQGPTGLTHSVVRELHPQTVQLTVASQPAGLQLSLNDATGAAPVTQTVIQGSENTISAPSPQSVGEVSYEFQEWSQGGPPTQVVTAPAEPITYTATFAAATPQNLALGQPATASGVCRADEGPEKAVNGSWTGGLRDKWCARPGASWWQVDLGAVVEIGTVVIRHAGAGGENPAWNTRDFAIQVSDDGTDWSTAVEVAGNTQDVTTHQLAATGRYLRLDVHTPTSTGNPATRIYQVEVYPPQA